MSVLTSYLNQDTSIGMDSITNPRHIAYVGSLRSSGDETGDQWITPPAIIELVRRVLGKIELDPFSSATANAHIRAQRYFTSHNSAFVQPDWCASTIYMNPPYSRGVCQKATARFIDEFNKKSFRAGVVLVNNMTDTVWFHDLWAHATRACFFKGRLSFMTADNKRESGNTRGQTLFLFEPQPQTSHQSL